MSTSNHSQSNHTFSQDLEDFKFPKIETKDDVIQQFFNQIVQYVIEDMIVIEPSEAEIQQEIDEIKDYKDLQPEDLSNYDIIEVTGSRVALTKHGSNTKPRKPSKLQNLETIKEESERSYKSSTETSEMPLKLNMKIIFNNGNFYEGEVSDGIMNGNGKYTWTNGTIYEGEFKQGFPTGYGRMWLPDLSHYVGQFNEGLFNGSGFLNIVSTPTFYSGEWKNGNRHGQGWLLYEPGDWYEGGWDTDLKHGFGFRHYKNGAKYEGMWYQGKYNGYGTMIFQNYDFYKGEWKDGLMHGFGEYIWKAFYNNNFAFPVQNIYRGFWENGQRSGEGTMIFGDDTGIKLEGVWDRDFKNGPGILTCGNGRVVQQLSLFHLDKSVKSNEQSSSKSLKGVHVDKPLELPLFTPPENVDVGFFIENILGQLSEGVSEEKLKVLRNYEANCVKNMILKYLPELKELYYEYASMAAKTPLNYKPIMCRLFLWQFYRDKEIHKRGISLAETDNILASSPNSCLDSLHNPFELIYFWQFLMSLIGVAVVTSNLDEIEDSTQEEGVTASAVKHFFDEIVFQKVEEKGSISFKYIDLVPIKSVYGLYQKLGEPHTARTFLRESCTKKGSIPNLCNLELFLKTKQIHFGSNLVPIDQNVVFENQSGDSFNFDIRRNWTNLYDFRHLGPKNIVRCLSKACPLITVDDIVVDMEYPLTFLEFYDSLLHCIFMVLELEMKKETKIIKGSDITLSEVVTIKSKTSQVSETKKKSAKKGKKKGKKKT